MLRPVQCGLNPLTHTLLGCGWNWTDSGHVPEQNLLRRVRGV